MIRRPTQHLPGVQRNTGQVLADLLPELVPGEDENPGPSRSMQEAVLRQDLLVNDLDRGTIRPLRLGKPGS